MRRPVALAAALAITVLTATVLAAAPAVSLARLTSSPSATGTATTGTLDPPTALAAGVSGTVVTLTWTPTTTTAATGYDLLRSTTSGSGYSVISSVTPRTAATTTNSPGTGTFYYVLQSSYQGWRSVNSNQATATAPATATSTGYKVCTANAPDTGGDGNGYQGTPGNGCAVDGALATDASSGTTTSTACTNAGKDRHRYSGYAFGLPGSFSAVTGIQVRLDAGINSTSGTNNLCVELSWNAGTSWTASKQVSLAATAVTTYVLGGTADTWGRAWTAAELGSANFRIRITDVSSATSRTFRLDGAQVQVTYTP